MALARRLSLRERARQVFEARAAAERSRVVERLRSLLDEVLKDLGIDPAAVPTEFRVDLTNPDFPDPYLEARVDGIVFRASWRYEGVYVALFCPVCGEQAKLKRIWTGTALEDVGEALSREWFCRQHDPARRPTAAERLAEAVVALMVERGLVVREGQP